MGTTTGTKWVQGYGEGMADILAKVRENVGRTDRTALDAVLLWIYDNSRGETAALASDSIATRADAAHDATERHTLATAAPHTFGGRFDDLAWCAGRNQA